ncbi:MAG TPA: tetratricopeptide repeat-containing protein [Pyrinomonadaceae bacterium]|nr:tetratricopeptide repeat-containing protein [Pyrinomonadaceae bacterium]
MAKKKKRCFVVMGYGTRTDPATGRALNLDASYKNLIKPAVTRAGLECVRADEIGDSGVIDVPMYQQILTADVVIADVSTANNNAFYELGVRHALRPFTTIIVAEDQFQFPFDISHVRVRTYKHLGEDIGASEARKFKGELRKAITDILNKKQPEDDSPVYIFLNKLRRLKLPDDLEAEVATVADAVSAANAAAPAAEVAPDETHRALMEQVEEAKKASDFGRAKQLLERMREQRPGDPYITQQLALVTYKDKKRDPKKRCTEARDLLLTLGPATSNDTQTLGLWGSVHKHMCEDGSGTKAEDAKFVNESVRAYERGFHLRNDYYNGINFAYMLNVRAAHADDRAEAIADFVQARRVREEVIRICDEWLKANPQPGKSAPAKARKQYLDSKYWVLATQAEAYLGTGQTAKAERLYRKAYALKPDGWMTDTTRKQRAKLEGLLAKSPLKYVKAAGK